MSVSWQKIAGYSLVSLALAGGFSLAVAKGIEKTDENDLSRCEVAPQTYACQKRYGLIPD